MRFTKASQTVSTNDVLTVGGSGTIALNSGTIKDTSVIELVQSLVVQSLLVVLRSQLLQSTTQM